MTFAFKSREPCARCDCGAPIVFAGCVCRACARNAASCPVCVPRDRRGRWRAAWCGDCRAAHCQPGAARCGGGDDHG